MARRRQRIRTDKDRARDRRRRANFTEAQREKKRQQDRKYSVAHPLRILLSDAKRRAKRVGVEFDLMESDFDLPLPTHCPILGIPLQYAGNGKGRQTDSSATIDKIDNDRGYITGNVLICSWKANRMKSDAGADELLALGNFYRRGENSNDLLYFATTIPKAPLQENELCDFYWKAK